MGVLPCALDQVIETVSHHEEESVILAGLIQSP
jgi:glycerol-3-phosphate responsive antiterminator